MSTATSKEPELDIATPAPIVPAMITGLVPMEDATQARAKLSQLLKNRIRRLRARRVTGSWNTMPCQHVFVDEPAAVAAPIVTTERIDDDDNGDDIIELDSFEIFGHGMWKENEGGTVEDFILACRATIHRNELQERDIGGQGGRNQHNPFLDMVLQYRNHLYREFVYHKIKKNSAKRRVQKMLLDYILVNGGRVLRKHQPSGLFYVATYEESFPVMAAKMRDGRLHHTVAADVVVVPV